MSRGSTTYGNTTFSNLEAPKLKELQHFHVSRVPKPKEIQHFQNLEVPEPKEIQHFQISRLQNQSTGGNFRFESHAATEGFVAPRLARLFQGTGGAILVLVTLERTHPYGSPVKCNHSDTLNSIITFE